MTQPFFFLLFLLTYFTGASAQFTMTQPPSVSASRGQTVRITCTREGGSISGYYVSWYQQKSGTKPLLVIYEDTSRPSGIPERFSGSVDSSSNSATMSISNVQSEDEADYYCLSYDSNAQTYVFGTGTELIVTGQPTVSPSVQVFAPSQEEIRSPNPHTVVCLLSDFSPPRFALQWKCDDKVITSGVETTKAAKQGDKYLASSYLKLTASDYEKYDTFTCQVTHERKTIVKSVSKSASC